VVVHTDGHIDALSVIEGLETRGLDWIVSVPDTLPLPLAPSADPHPADTAVLQTATEPVGDLLRRHARPAVATPRTPGRPRLGTVRVLPPGATRPVLLVGVWTSAHPKPDRIWLTNMPPTPRTRALAVTGSATAARVGATEAELGLHDFAGRSYPGWHRHATLVSIASAHRRLGHKVCPAPGSG